MLENFNFLLLYKNKFYSMTLYNACLAFAVLKTDEGGSALTCLRRVVEAMKQHDQVNFSCASSCKKLLSCVLSQLEV